MLETLGIQDVRTAPWSPWQNGMCERLMGSIRRELLNHVIVLNERHLSRLLSSYFKYYNESSTHLSLEKDAPRGRMAMMPDEGDVVAIPQVGGLHHRYERRKRKVA